MKFTAKYKDGTLILDRPITPKGDTVHVEIPDEEIARPSSGGGSPDAGQSAAAAIEEEARIRRMMEEDPFLRELWKELLPRPAKAHGKSDKELFMEAVSENPKYFPNR